MSLPDADRSKRIYPLLQNLDLENLAFATMQSTGEPIAIEEMNEDELRRLVLVNLARLTVKGEWNGLLTSSSGSTWGQEIISVPLDETGFDYDRWTLSCMPPFGANSIVTSSSQVFTTFIPFIAPRTGDVTEIGRENTTTVVGMSDFIGIYSSDSTGSFPATLLGFGTFDTTVASTQYDTTLSATISLTAGTQYWIGFTTSSTTSSAQFKMVNQFYRPIHWPDSDLMVTNGGAAVLKTLANESALGSSYTAEDLAPSGSGPQMPIVSIKVS